MKRIIVKYESSVPHIYPGHSYVGYQITNTSFQFLATDELAIEIEQRWNEYKSHKVDYFMWDNLVTLIRSYESMNGHTFMPGTVSDIKILPETRTDS